MLEVVLVPAQQDAHAGTFEQRQQIACIAVVLPWLGRRKTVGDGRTEFASVDVLISAAGNDDSINGRCFG